MSDHRREKGLLMGKLAFKTLRENVAEEIRLKILNQELTPGMRIIEQELSDELGVSRGPIREALRQLEQEGMVEYTRNVGCSVREITLQDVYETYLLRSNYEMIAVRLYEAQFTEEEIAKMEEAVELMRNLTIENYSDVVSYGCMLHAVIIEKAGLARLTKAWSDLEYGEILSCNAGFVDKQSVIERQYPIHRDLVDVCKTRDVDAVCQAISDHYMVTVKRLKNEEQGGA
jgi:DNA-binding GntR family transcriptional regulator